jgi:hypothetical protein
VTACSGGICGADQWCDTLRGKNACMPVGLLSQWLPATASSSYASSDNNALAWRAVDGNDDGWWGDGSLFHSNQCLFNNCYWFGSDNNPWWQVDLGATHWIESLEIRNRDHHDYTNEPGFYVDVSSDGSAWTTIGGYVSFTYDEWNPNLVTVRTNGRYVRLRGASMYMPFAEVRVWGDAQAALLSKGATATASSAMCTWAGSPYNTTICGNASNAVDGRTDGNWNHGIFHSNDTANPWLEVDLGATHYIRSVDLFPRTDDANYPTHAVTVLVYNAKDGSGNPISPTSISVPTVATPSRVPIAGNARYVRAQSTNAGGDNYLRLAEVQVWGSP